MLITPETVAAALAKTDPAYVQMHKMNAEHPMVKGCKLGAVFGFNGVDYVYVGVNGRNRKFPLIALNLETRHYMKMTAKTFERVRIASSQA